MSKYQDIAQQFLYSQAVMNERGKELLVAAGEIERVKDNKVDQTPLALAVSSFNVARQKFGDAGRDLIQSAKELDKYFTRGGGAGPSI